jgi:alpha-L-rhamnosidase
MNSFNHYSLGSIGNWLYGHVAGIDQQPGSVAYGELLLRPTVGGRLTWATARQQSPRGEVECGWSLADGELRVDVAVPPGVTALLHLPAAEPEHAREGGHDLGESPGVTVVDVTADMVVLALNSGRFAFTTRSPVPNRYPGMTPTS